MAAVCIRQLTPGEAVLAGSSLRERRPSDGSPVPWLYALRRGRAGRQAGAHRPAGAGGPAARGPGLSEPGPAQADPGHRPGRLGQDAPWRTRWPGSRLPGGVPGRDQGGHGRRRARLRAHHRRPADPADLRRLLRRAGPAAAGRGDRGRRGRLRASGLGTRSRSAEPHSRTFGWFAALSSESVARSRMERRMAESHTRAAHADAEHLAARPGYRAAELSRLRRSMWTRPTATAQSWPRCRTSAGDEIIGIFRAR